MFSQGFYDNNEVFISQKNVSNLNITSVTATTNYPDSSFHPLSNFVFEYSFDRSGGIIYKKHWHIDYSNDDGKYLFIRLNIDSTVEDSANIIYYRNIAWSPTVKFNQFKGRTEKYIHKTFEKFKITNTAINNYTAYGSDANKFLIDTILLGQSVCIPKWLIPSGDSILITRDNIKTFTKSDSSLYLIRKYYLLDNGEIKIDLMLRDYQGVWRSYYIDKSGFVYKETQYNYTTLYFYNADRLHVKTENYQYDYKTGQTIFTYKKASW